ncbi:unnamed protein product [Mytilus edulis]|uniref:Uncharacterized protein n=1 Tax=Mytilus edulis TaxID=6550 RepID=A0A8S3VH58_MYTED|nr:unnamed protein product [Mytilus edulis]
MTFDQSGSRKDSNKRPLVLANLDKTENLDDFLSIDQIDRSLSANGIRQISMKVLSTGSASVENGKRNISFPGSDQNEIDMSVNNITNNDSMLETDNLDGKVIADSGKAQEVDLAETDSGHFSSSSSTKQQNDNKGSKITISIDEVSDDEDVQAGLEDTVEELASFLKADDEFNRARRLTGDSGIADDDYSPPSSDEDVDNLGYKRRFIRLEINDQELESTRNIPNDKVFLSGRNGDPFDNKISSSTSKKEDQNSITSDVDQPSNYIDKSRCPDVDNKTDTGCKPIQICENESEVENFVQNPKTSNINDRLKDGSKSHLKPKPNAIEKKNTQFEAENSNSEDDGEENFHSDEEEDRILEEIRPNLHMKKQLFDDSTSNAFSAESWSVYDSGHDCTLSESNFDAFPYQNVDKTDDGKFARNGIRDSIGKDEMCDSAGKDEISESAGKDEMCESSGKDEMCDSAGKDEMCESAGKDEMCESAGKDDICDAGKADFNAKDRLDNQTAQNLSCDDKINAVGYEKLDLLRETGSSDIEKTTLVEETFEKPKDITFVKSDENTGEDIVDLANDNGSNDGEHLFHSDEEEQQILAEIRPNLHLKKPMLDETRSNTLSLQSAESWSMYESGDDYSLSETNLDALSYQDIDDENFFLCKFGEKPSKIGDLKTTNHIEDIQNGKESSLIQENEIKNEDSRQSHKTPDKESNDEGINSELVSDFDTEKSLNKDKGIGISTEIDIGKSPTKDVIGALVSDIDFDESHNKDTRIGILTDFDNDKSPTKDIIGELVSDIDVEKSLNKAKDIRISTEIENDKSPTKVEICELMSDIGINESPDKDKGIGILSDFGDAKSPTKDEINTRVGISTDIDIDKSPTKDVIGELVSDIGINESPNKDIKIGNLSNLENDKSPTKEVIRELESDIDIEESPNNDKGIGTSTDFDNDKYPTTDVIGELVFDIDIKDSLTNDKIIGILSDFDKDKSPTKDEIGELELNIDIDDSSNKDERFGILADFDNDKCPTKDVIGELVSDIDIDESHKKDKSSAILLDIETDTTNTKDKIDCLVVNIDVDESPNKDQVGELLVDVDVDKSLSINDNKMQILADIDINESLDEMELLSENEFDNNQCQDSDIHKKKGQLLDKSKDMPANHSALDDDQRQVEQSNKILQDYNEKFRSLGEQENDSCRKQGKNNENDESELLTVDLRDTPYSSDEYIDDESDVSVEEIEEERCDILKQLDLSTYVINDASRKQQLPIVEENTSPELSDDNDCKNVESDTPMNSTIKDKETNKNSANDNQKSNDKIIMNDTSDNEQHGITCDDKEFQKRHGIEKLQQLHSMSASDEIYDESIGLESLSDTRPALPNTLFIGDNQSLASLMGRIITETNTLQNASPPELEDVDFNDFVNILAVVPGKDARILLSPISEEGTVSQIAESVDTLSPESVDEQTVKKPKRPSLIDLTVTDTDGVVERINLQNIDVLQSFSKPCNFDQPIETGMEQIPRIVKGPSSITAIDSEEIILQWTITGFPEPEVVIFKDGETLDICDGITLENDKNTWTLQIPYGMKEDAGLYEICAVNSSGNDILKTRVYVKSAKNSPVREDKFNNDQREEQIGVPEFLKSPSNVEVKEGDIIHVECQITEWRTVLPEERVEILQDSTKCQLIIQKTEPEDAGIYMCRASNSVGVNQVQFTVCVTDQGDKIQTATDINNDEDRAEWNLVPGLDKAEYNLVPGQDKAEWNLVPGLDKAEFNLVPGLEKAEWNTVSSHDRVDKPTAPVIQLDMSESDECFSRRYEVISDYHDEFNDIDLQQGEIIEVLDRSKQSHWLVKSMQDHTKVCYAPPYLLDDTDKDHVEMYLNGIKVKQRVLYQRKKYKLKQILITAIVTSRKVLADLLESETDYICDLKDLIDTYSQSLEKGKVSDRKNIKEGKISNKKPVADKQDKILEDLSKLYQFHKETLLPSLLQTQDDAEIVGDLFTERRGSFCEYVPFVSDHDKAMDDTDPDQLAALMEAFSLILGDPANAFEDLMNRPLERIHEYIELLKTLIKLTAQSGGDCSGLMAAVQMLTEICRTMEDIVLLDKIEGYQGDVKQLGPVLKHEDVKVKVDKESESEGQRHVILFQDKIMVAKPMTSDPKGKLEFEKIIELKDLSVGKQEETDGSSSCTIELWEDKSLELSASPSLKLQVQDIHAKQAWVRDIQEAKKKLADPVSVVTEQKALQSNYPCHGEVKVVSCCKFSISAADVSPLP